MHVPDGFLSTPVALSCAALAVAGVGAAASRSRALLGSRAVPRMGVTAAFVFSAQMINFPVAGGRPGTSWAGRSRPYCSGLLPPSSR